MRDFTLRQEEFYHALVTQYRTLFELPDYAAAKARTTPESMALRITQGFIGQGDEWNKDGDGIRRVCKQLKVKHTYAAIRAYLKE